jgi:holo-[acyl-carrier protein] synthase
VTRIANGVDLVEIERFQTLDPKIKRRFFERVFTTAELAEKDQSLQHLAGKFAAKEAASKALGCGIGEVGWHDLEILENTDGQPHLMLHQAAELAARHAGWTSWSVSISHTRTYALAMVTVIMDSAEV